MSGPTIYHGTPLSPVAALRAMAGRAFCVSFYRPDDVETVEQISDDVMYDNGAFSFWKQALKAGREQDERERDWQPYYAWLEQRQVAGRWAIIPDVIGAPSQINDGQLNDWPFGPVFGSPVWHMNGPLERLPRLAEKYDRVCLGWVGETAAEMAVGCDAYRRRMDEVAALFGNDWPKLHMLRGVAVARDYPFRQRRQHQPRAERMALRQPARHVGGRSLARKAGVC